MLEHAPKLPRVVREDDFHKASRMILDPNTIAVVTPYGETFRAACKSYETFALQRSLTPESECFYRTETGAPDQAIALGVSNKLTGGRRVIHDPKAQYMLNRFFDDLGFSEYDSPGSQTIVTKILYCRQLLANLYPGTASSISTQINVGGSVTLPHIHNDIALGMTICGPSTMLVNPEQAQDYRFDIRREQELLLLGSMTRHPETHGHLEGYMSIRKHHFLFFKGAREFGLPFGHPDNIGAVHRSPDDQIGMDGSPTPRMFIASFIHPPGWENMELYMPPLGED
jgi:hypothetical protein